MAKKGDWGGVSETLMGDMKRDSDVWLDSSFIIFEEGGSRAVFHSQRPNEDEYK